MAPAPSSYSPDFTSSPNAAERVEQRLDAVERRLEQRIARLDEKLEQHKMAVLEEEMSNWRALFVWINIAILVAVVTARLVR